MSDGTRKLSNLKSITKDSPVGAQSIGSESIRFDRTEPSTGTCTFKEITFVPSPGPDVDDSVYVLGWDSLPACDDADGVPVACPVVPVLVEPVPAVAEKVRAKPQQRRPAVVFLSADPVKRSVK